MKRGINDIENEIRHQICIAEICLDICKMIPPIPGRGSDFLPFFYNLNFSKGINVLHSLLLSGSPDEISIKNYIEQYKTTYSGNDISDMEEKIASIARALKEVLPFSLRHKVCAHLDQGFNHKDFAYGYTLPDLREKFSSITIELKEVFFTFTNYSPRDYLHLKILRQSEKVVKDITNLDRGYEL